MIHRAITRSLLMSACVGIALLNGCVSHKMQKGAGTDINLPEQPRETLLGTIRGRCPDTAVVSTAVRPRGTCTSNVDTLPDPSPRPGQKTP